MRIAWLINIVIPELAEALGLWKTSLGGWLIGQMNGLKDTGHHLTVICVTNGVNREVWRQLQGIEYCVLPDMEEGKLKDSFVDVMNKVNPDVFHIFGTETIAAPIAFEVADKSKTVVSIQGLIGMVSTHFGDGIPEKYYKSTVIKRLAKKIIGGTIIEDDAKRLARSGLREKKIIEQTKYIIGRTTWDRACTYQINPNANYYICREILRDSFYRYKWNIDKCQRHSIFLSQSSSPIKGLHQVLKALPLILEHYPDTVINVAGAPLSSFGKRSLFKQKAAELYCGYQGYIEMLVRENDLYGKIKFLNYLDENQMREQYLKTNVFVLPSSIENSPNSLGEAMLLGVPCVASCVGGVQDMLSAPEEGFIYPFEEPYMLAYYVCSIFASDELANSMSLKARGHALSTHSIEKNTAELLKIYDKIREKK